MQVTVSAADKGNDLTIDDILFATRALAMDDTRTVTEGYAGYTVLEQRGDTLILEPDIDNFST